MDMHQAAQVEGRLMPSLRAAWCAATSTDSGWTPLNPPLGQCAVTALIVQDHFGGDLVRGLVDGQSHYWNRIDGVDIDLTIEQFGPGAVAVDIVDRDRNYVLSFPDTVTRYRALRQRVAAEQQRRRAEAGTPAAAVEAKLVAVGA